MYGVNGNCHRKEKRNDVTDMWAPQRGVYSRASLDDGSAQRDYLEQGVWTWKTFIALAIAQLFRREFMLQQHTCYFISDALSIPR